ncbi:MAG: DUF4013 domain-containing protein [Methanocalculus sp. MSAO_Arc1]|uniref:DUF4013 domain-containing protein n=1 Tax=Methanocalculus TaxID=71151 RepID=UPI000FEF290B|nr:MULTISPECIES: DUF4013 domain-containing protein [unclassified Methanocalculus]MCP1661986.1 hypothetical protein [Methanocalculus sp. AMF5]RQD79886.1 MAG: DUF4013 domain-containing protein [Methanocalculus sp. MSAO_Arc1]
MEYGQMLGDSFEYTKECLVGKWMKWVLLIISAIIFPLLYGYLVRIFKGTKPAPELEDWGSLFIDGIKLLIVGIIYALPVLIVAFLLMGGTMFAAAMGGDMGAAVGAMGALTGMLVVFILAFIIWLFVPMAYIRFARTGSIGEAFNFSAILGHIGKVGWINYIIALIILGVVIALVQFVLGIIPIIGWFLMIVLIPAFAIFGARYITLIYDSVPA